MTDNPDYLPEDIERQLFALLDGPAGGIAAGVERLCARYPQHAQAIRQAGASMVVPPPSTVSSNDPLAGPPREIGPFHILSEIGAGGMGIVYLAEQRTPVSRRVALKVIKLGMDTRRVLGRFEIERQALAMMDHVAIAKVFEAGATSQGKPYFAMEYVKGVPITRYCDDNKLSIEDRLGLFLQVCSGVQHAHHKGVIHRDLTPNNILVSVQDGKPMAKIIDFGLARATDHRLTEKTVFTQRGEFMGTLEYVSPEQAGLDGLDIDTRSDVYTLGILLYELLTGTVPFTSAELRKGGFDQICKIIRSAEPEKPSTKLTSTQKDTTTTARLRRTEPGKLLRRLRGDLDWIVLRCLEKDRTRRYQTVTALADDIDRHLKNQPIDARPPTATYILRKLARRYRGPLVAGGLVILALVAGFVASTLLWLKWRRVADENRVNLGLATARAAEITEQKARLQAATDERQKLAARFVAVARFDDLNRQHDGLWPATAARAPALAEWLARAETILASRPDLEAAVREIEANALPQSEEERQRDRQTHPRANDLASARRKVEVLRRAQAVRQGESVVIPGLSAADLASSAEDLNGTAWDGVAPWPEQRKYWGEEAKCVALAQAALDKIDHGDKSIERAFVLDTLMWALFATGRDAEALAAGERAIEASGLGARSAQKISHDELKRAIAAAPRELAAATAEVQALEADVGVRGNWRFANDIDQCMHAALRDKLTHLADFEAVVVKSVRQRLAWIKLDDSLGQQHAGAWEGARQAIRAADGKKASRLYASVTIDLAPQTGLVPIGMNPKTKLWEFYHPRSASDPRVLPHHDPEGGLDIDDSSGLVFVLVPGATFDMGAQGRDRNGANYDPMAETAEGPVHSVSLAPFFLSRYEMTQAQWQRLTVSGNPSLYADGAAPAGLRMITGTNPVEHVSWNECTLWLERHALLLPTEAQWEYACRAGTTTPWSCGDHSDALALHANIADQTAVRQPWACEPWDDGHLVHAPVGSFAPNDFGLHDMHGNVWEWCRDLMYGYNELPRPGDGMRGDQTREGPGVEQAPRVYRGGGFSDPARKVRSSNRDGFVPDFRGPLIGVRPARLLTR